MKTNRWSVKLATFAVLLSILSGCVSYVQLKYGVTQPKEVTPAKLYTFLEKQHFPTENLYMFSDSAAYNHAMRNPQFCKYLIGHMVFDRDGVLLQRDTTACQWAGYDFIKSLNRDSTYQTCNDLQLNQLIGCIEPFGKNPHHTDRTENPDFTIIVTWAKFLGKYNYRLFALSDAVALNATARIRLIWLNADMQESWNLPSDQKIAIK